MVVGRGGRRQGVRLGSSLVVAIVIGLLAGCDATPVVVSGTVTAAPSGTGVGAMAVQIYADDAEVLVTAATTNVSGGWELRASTLADGTYRVRIGDRWWPDAGSWAQAQSVVLSAGAVTVLDVSVEEVGELTGGVVDDAGEPLAGVAAVLVRVSDGQSVGATETGADGAFVLPVTAAGSYRVLLADPSETWPSVFVGGTTATDFAVSAGTVAVGTIDISTGEPHVSPPVLGTTTRVSLGVGGAEISDGDAQDPAISADGTVVAFASHASDVVVGDANHTDDVFVHDRATGVTSRVSVASDGTEADLWSLDPALSADGRFVAFWSGASNLVAGDTNGSFDVFVHDRSTGVTSRASVASGGAQADGYSARPAISADGRFVTFDSGAPNLVAGDTNGATDVFVHDRATGVTSRVSVASDGAQADGGGFNPTISADGRHIAFGSHSTDLVPGDTNGAGDVFVHDRSTGATTRVSVASGGIQAGGSYVWAPDISADGRFVTFVSDSTDLVPGDTNRTRDAFVHDRSTGVTTRVSVASDGTETDGLSFVSVISGDGRFVAFGSYAANLVPDDTNDTSDVFLHDRSTGTTTRVSVASDGTQGDEIIEWDLGISVDGRQVVFATYASTLVPDDTNFSVDVFLHERPAA